MGVEWKKGGGISLENISEIMKIWKVDESDTEKDEKEMEASLTHPKAEIGLIKWKTGEKKGKLGGVYVERRHEVEGETITHIYEITMEVGLRRKGIGGAIVKARAEAERGKKVKGMILQVATDNWGARKAYEKWGFEEMEVQLGEEGGDAILEMRWIWDEGAKERMRGTRERRRKRESERIQGREGRNEERRGRGKKGEAAAAIAEVWRWEERGKKEGATRWEIWYMPEEERVAELWLVVEDRGDGGGRVLLAGRDFMDKEAVVAYLGEGISEEEMNLRNEKKKGDHIMQIGKRLVDGRKHKCGGQYMNTCMPWDNRGNNVKMMGAPWGTLRIKSKNGVKQGDELLLDYGEDYWASAERQELLKRIREKHVELTSGDTDQNESHTQLSRFHQTQQTSGAQNTEQGGSAPGNAQERNINKQRRTPNPSHQEEAQDTCGQSQTLPEVSRYKQATEIGNGVDERDRVESIDMYKPNRHPHVTNQPQMDVPRLSREEGLLARAGNQISDANPTRGVLILQGKKACKERVAAACKGRSANPLLLACLT